jgi:hypothetical protein
MATISGGRATDERVTCLRIFADANGETHMEDVDITLSVAPAATTLTVAALNQNEPDNSAAILLPAWIMVLSSVIDPFALCLFVLYKRCRNDLSSPSRNRFTLSVLCKVVEGHDGRLVTAGYHRSKFPPATLIAPPPTVPFRA